MRKTKPKKRLVSKEQYVRVMGKKIGYSTVATVSALLTCLGGLTTGILFLIMLTNSSMASIVFGPFLLSLLATWILYSLSKHLFVRANTIAAVSLITDQNAHLLPAQETLLRGSDLPPTKHQSELLRAAQPDQETPADQLLRATTGEE